MTFSLPMPRRLSELDWLDGFHAGERHVLDAFYREYFDTVNRAVGRLLEGPDRETVVHEVFFRVLSKPELRRAFSGGSPAAWIATVARNHAIDFRRRRNREVPEAEPGEATSDGASGPQRVAESAEARLLLERFCRDVLPAHYEPVFRACFVERLTQREAAAALGVSRTTLLYRQHRVRALLKTFLLEAES